VEHRENSIDFAESWTENVVHPYIMASFSRQSKVCIPLVSSIFLPDDFTQKELKKTAQISV